MNRRYDIILAALIAETLILGALLFLVWARLRGFDASLCEAYGECGWRYA